MNLEDTEDWELQQALSLSLQDKDQEERHISQQPTTSQQQPSPPQPPQSQRKNKNKPLYNPTPTEIQSSFEEISSANTKILTAQDLRDAGARLGLEIDDEQLIAMLEYATEKKLKQSTHSPITIDLEDFKRIAEHFRVL